MWFIKNSSMKIIHGYFPCLITNNKGKQRNIVAQKLPWHANNVILFCQFFFQMNQVQWCFILIMRISVIFLCFINLLTSYLVSVFCIPVPKHYGLHKSWYQPGNHLQIVSCPQCDSIDEEVVVRSMGYLYLPRKRLVWKTEQ